MIGVKGNEEALEKLATVLDSGEYSQGKSALRPTEDKFCCLGVACDLMIKDGFGQWEKNITGMGIRGWTVVPDPDLPSNGGNLPYEYHKHYGINRVGTFYVKNLDFEEFDRKGLPTDLLKDVVEGFNQRALSELNDNGVEFRVIAEVIRQMVKTSGWVPYRFDLDDYDRGVVKL